MGRISVLIVTLVLGCGSKEDTAGIEDCQVGDLGGVGQAKFDGNGWAASGGVWMESGANITINLESDTKQNININAKKGADGTDVQTLISESQFPIVIDLSGDDGYGGVMDLRNGQDGYQSTNPGGSGTFVIAGVDGDILTGCFEFDAVNTSTQVMIEVREGQVKIDR